MGLGRLISTLFLGATLAIASCSPTVESEGDCNPGRTWSESRELCCADTNYNQICDDEENFGVEDVYQPQDIQPEADTKQGLDLLVEETRVEDTFVGEDSVIIPDIPNVPDVPNVPESIEEIFQPYVPPANCLICDEFSDPGYTENNWNIVSGNMPPLITGADYEVSGGTLTANDYSFNALKTFDYNLPIIFEVRYRLIDPDSSLTINMYKEGWPDNPIVTITANKYDSGMIEMDVDGLTDSEPAIIGEWHKCNFDRTGGGVTISIDDKVPKYHFTALYGELDLLFSAEKGKVEIDYLVIIEP